MLVPHDPQVKTAVEFLSEVFEKGVKGHKETELRKYLSQKQHLTTTQVTLAFKIYNSQIQSRKVKGQAERSEVSAQKRTSGDYDFFVPTNRERGIKFISGFRKTEYKYCNVLECLIEEYWKYLDDMADRKKIPISRKELETIFHCVFRLYNFHKKFYLELKSRKDRFGQLFVQHFNSFCDYVEYMKDCNCIIKKMREYIFDTKLRKSLDNLRATSRRPNDDMMDLILSPMYRIKDYKEFIDKLYGWADKTGEPDYLFLGKASRKMGRVVKWIEMYKHSIINKNEMNKVQQFLNTQCSIITPTRRIVRRGVMTRRTTTWPARNKYYIFFLFNDVLLWTTKKSELQNLVLLRNCVVRSSESKYNQARKFEVESNIPGSNNHKLLKLECKDLSQRNEWYNAIKREIASVQEVSVKEGNIGEFGEEDLVKYIEKDAERQSSLGIKTLPKSKSSLELKRDEESDTTIESEDEENSERPTHRRLQSSRNFLAQVINDRFLPLDEISVTSETEQNLLMNTNDSYGDGMDRLYPNTNRMTTQSESLIRIKGQDKMSSGCVYHQKGVGSTEQNKPSISTVSIPAPIQHPSLSISIGSIKNELPDNLYSSNYPRKKRNGIYRNGKYINNLERNSSYTIYLSNFVQ